MQVIKKILQNLLTNQQYGFIIASETAKVLQYKITVLPLLFFIVNKHSAIKERMFYMSSTITPKGYRPALNIQETEKAIAYIKKEFPIKLSKALNLSRVSAPLFVDASTGLNDNLNNVEHPVSFTVKETGRDAEIVHSLAKWKRYALYKYGFEKGFGLWTDMNAIRRDEDMDNLHSVYVDQWDWESIIPDGMRNEAYLKETVRKIAEAICCTAEEVKRLFPALPVIPLTMKKEVSFVTTQELEDMYPDKTPKERENIFLKTHKTAFIMGIGDKLKSGEKHDGRAPDYDDWKLNGDLLFWNEILECAFEISSMGIRVDSKSMTEQLKKSDCEDRQSLPFHSMVLDGTLPLTIGGGIGQSRMCMLLLAKAHIGEVQVSLWDDETKKICSNAGIDLL